MTDLTEALAKRAELTDREIDSFVLVCIQGHRWMKWFRDDGSFFHQLVSPDEIEGWVSRSKREHEFDDDPGMEVVAEWAKHDFEGYPRPTTDANAMREAVRAFAAKEIDELTCEAGIRIIDIHPLSKFKDEQFDQTGYLVGPCIRLEGILSCWMVEPRDVCIALLDALAESERA